MLAGVRGVPNQFQQADHLGDPDRHASSSAPSLSLMSLMSFCASLQRARRVEDPVERDQRKRLVREPGASETSIS
jgi:hypothetical protein